MQIFQCFRFCFAMQHFVSPRQEQVNQRIPDKMPEEKMPENEKPDKMPEDKMPEDKMTDNPYPKV